MSSPILRGLALGYSAEKILKFMTQAFPALGPKIKQATAAGYTIEQIVKLLHKGMGGGEDLDTLSEQQVHKRRSEQQGQWTKDLLKTGLGATATLGASGLLGSNANQPAPMPLQATPSPQPPIGPAPMANAPVQPPPIPPVGPAPTAGMAQSAPIAPQTPPIAPQSEQAIQSTQTTPAVDSASILKEMGIEENVKTLAGSGNSPEGIARVLEDILKPGQKKWLAEKIKSGQAKPLVEMVNEYIATKPSPTEQPVRPVSPLTQEHHEEMSTRNVDAQADEWERMEAEKESKDNIDYWENNLASSKTPPKTVKEKLRKVEAEMTKLENQFKGTGRTVNATSNKDETMATVKSLEAYRDHLKKIDGMKSGDFVFDESKGISGEIKDIRSKEALVDSNGKLEKVDLKDVEKTPEELIEAAKSLLNIPEVDRSSVLSLATYRPSTKQMFIQYHNGETYVYEDVPKERVDEIAEALGIPVTSGRNIYGAWEQGKQDSRGAALIHGILRDPKYAKDQEGKTWEKLGTFYDYWKKLRKPPKRKKK